MGCTNIPTREYSYPRTFLPEDSYLKIPTREYSYPRRFLPEDSYPRRFLPEHSYPNIPTRTFLPATIPTQKFLPTNIPTRVCKYPKKIVPGGSGIPELFFRVSGRISGILFPPEMASITLNLANFKKQKIFLSTGGQLEHLFIQF